MSLGREKYSLRRKCIKRILRILDIKLKTRIISPIIVKAITAQYDIRISGEKKGGLI